MADPARTRLVDLRLRWRGTCEPGPGASPLTPTTISVSERPWRVAVGPGGVWSSQDEGPPRRVDGLEVVDARLIGGRVRADRLTGVFAITRTERDATGAVVRVCRSSRIGFSLRDRGRFGGLSSQGLPVSVTLAPGGRSIARLDWTWRGGCGVGSAAPSGTRPRVEIDETLTDITLRGGVIPWSRYTYGPDVIQGIRTRWTYDASGRRVGRSFQGTITANSAEVVARTGAVIRQCQSGVVRFVARD